jgi:DMSO/TMAO reductase YedYZ molybdopterin-dependent catalytic subunit
MKSHEPDDHVVRAATGSPRPGRRAVLKGGAALVAVLGMPIPHVDKLFTGLLPVGLAAAAMQKAGLTLLGDRPLNMETPADLLDDEITPAARMFVRNNGLMPDVSRATDSNWTLRVDGEVDNPLALTIADLKRDFEPVTLRLQLECAGNGRRFYHPGTSGNQWTFGAVCCPTWTGVRLRDVLARARVRSTAVYTAHYGSDQHLSGAGKDAISRGVPIAKALDEHNLIAFSLADEPLPVENGHPLRLVIPGWPGSCSQKWLTRITLRDRVHDGEKMTGDAYRVPAYPVAPGSSVPDEDMVIIESLPVKSLITAPRTGHRIATNQPLEVRGHAWAGDREVARVELSSDFGATWLGTTLAPPANRYAWQRWHREVGFSRPGYYEIWARATDSAGISQPPVTPGWNPKGYLNNMQHRIAVFVT